MGKSHIVHFFILLLLLFINLTGQYVIERWGRFEKQVRDGELKRVAAKKEFVKMIEEIKKYSREFSFAPQGKWAFPIKGYSIKDAGKGGFRPNIPYGGSNLAEYNFYDGNRHGGHPTYDIFIHDKNQDCIDDHTGKPAEAIAPMDLLILSVNTNWEKDSGIRGGNYIWAFDAVNNRMFYYAHLDSVSVTGGQFVKKGTAVGTIGRSGKNAWPERCPTHLHLMVLEVWNDELLPYDFWEDIN